MPVSCLSLKIHKRLTQCVTQLLAERRIYLKFFHLKITAVRRHCIESAVFHIYQNTADSMAGLNLENCGPKVLGNAAEGDFFSLEIRVNFERP